MNPITNKPIVLQGHSRPIKDIEFSTEGDLLYTASNDRNVICWNSLTGEKIKQYAHSAAVNIISITIDGVYMITGDNTGCVYIWETKGGVLLKKLEQDPTYCVRSINISYNDEFLVILYAGRIKGAKSFLSLYRFQDIINYTGEEEKKEEPISILNSIYEKKSLYVTLHVPLVIPENSCKISPLKIYECKNELTKYVQAKFAIQNRSILVSREDGFLELINLQNGKIITESKFHDDIILDFDVDVQRGIILTASRDGYACVINFDTFQVINKFHPENPTRNLNACKIAVIDNPDYININSINETVNKINEKNKSEKDLTAFSVDLDNLFASSTINEVKKTPIKKAEKEIILATLSGGQDSKLVTTTNAKEGGFEIIIYNALGGNEMANFQAHFGPVNTLSAYKNILASGAEDATVRLHKLENYLFPIDKNK